MRKGEKAILWGIVGVIALSLFSKVVSKLPNEKKDKGIPYYSDAPKELVQSGYALYKKYVCKECHTLWSIRSYMQSVPAPAMDGIGSIRDEAWFFRYLSAENPQNILPSRLKKKYQMPSYAKLSEQDRRTLAAYLASLKVEDWYLQETKKNEYEKLTGKDYNPQS